MNALKPRPLLVWLCLSRSAERGAAVFMQTPSASALPFPRFRLHIHTHIHTHTKRWRDISRRRLSAQKSERVAGAKDRPCLSG